jgi:hypothetical protein
MVDCSRGPSETITFFLDSFGPVADVPWELLPGPGSELVWDAVGVVVDPDYRTGEASAWLYHAVFRRAMEEGVVKIIANMTLGEIRNVRTLFGITFEEVPNLGPAYYRSSTTGKETEFRFVILQMHTIWPLVSEAIRAREASSSGWDHKLARLARIALVGGEQVELGERQVEER